LLGDLKLKTNDDYVVPEELRANADQKLFQLMEQQKVIYQKQYQFDTFIQNMVQNKQGILEFIQNSVERLHLIQRHIPENERLSIPETSSLEIDAQPQTRYQPNDSRINAHFSRINDVGKVDSNIPEIPVESKQQENSDNSSCGGVFPCQDSGLNDDDSNCWSNHRVVTLINEQGVLIDEINKKKEEFNHQIELANLVRGLLDVHIGAGRIAADTLLQESWLLEQFESREQASAKLIQQRIQDLHNTKRSKQDCERQAIEKQMLTVELQRSLKNLDDKFQLILPDNAKAADWLTKVFRKKIKRKKQVSKEEQKGSDSESDSDDSDSDFSDDESFGSEGGSVFDEKVKPAAISDEAYEKCLEMRENRLDLEEELVEVKKQYDIMKKEADALVKKVKANENQLKQARSNSEQLQQDKQKELNQLWVTVPMFYKNITQKLIQVPIKSKAAEREQRSELPKPKKLNECLVLPANTIDRLNNRIRELEEEQQAQQKLQDAARQQRIALARQKGEMEQRCKELKEQAKQLMELRFGRVLDIESLQTTSLTNNRGIDELLSRIKQIEQQISDEYSLWNQKIATQTEQLTEITQHNTDLLRQLDELNAEQARLKAELEQRQQGESKPTKQFKHPEDYMTGSGDVRLSNEQKEETEQLESLIRAQTEKMNALTAEIEQLSRKGGTVPPPK